MTSDQTTSAPSRAVQPYALQFLERLPKSQSLPIGIGAGVALGCALAFIRAGGPPPGTVADPAWAEATKAYLKQQKVNPIFGAASK
jgi:hypothetical protein